MPTGILFAKDLLPDIRLEPTARRIRAVVTDGAGVEQILADTTDAYVLFERDHLPTYYLPHTALCEGMLLESDHHTFCPRKGTASYFHVQVGDRLIENAIWYYPEPTEHVPELADLVALYWDRVDHWFEEDEEVFKHARDPYHRVDALRSSRHVQIVLGGEIVADTTNPTLLFETGLPTRYYIPEGDVRRELLTRPTRRACARTKERRATGRSRSATTLSPTSYGATRSRSRSARRSPACCASSTSTSTPSSSTVRRSPYPSLRGPDLDRLTPISSPRSCHRPGGRLYRR